ncbi:hypothetical protein KM043_006595 [Ampulex compressa]|nr:hypothetical protein KM043_006595 [Ampulex compressa]
MREVGHNAKWRNDNASQIRPQLSKPDHEGPFYAGVAVHRLTALGSVPNRKQTLGPRDREPHLNTHLDVALSRQRGREGDSENGPALKESESERWSLERITMYLMLGQRMQRLRREPYSLLEATVKLFCKI